MLPRLEVCQFSAQVVKVCLKRQKWNELKCRDVHETFWVETETRPRRSKFCPRRDRNHTFKIRDETKTRRCSFRDAGRDLEAPETLESRKLQRLAKTFSVTCGETHRQWKKLYGLINSHRGKHFLFVILWVFALYFGKYHWIINSLHHKELQLQCCRHEPLCLSQLASNWN